jgi:hypothetical protein
LNATISKHNGPNRKFIYNHDLFRVMTEKNHSYNDRLANRRIPSKLSFAHANSSL